MSAPVPSEVLERQLKASDPARSAWVSANAGSGKTYVLAQRVIRLLLAGTKPEKILCLTFTKATAANMANRVFETLGAWTALDDTALDKAIRTMSNEKPDAAHRALARRLFAQALETPGGLKVQTIHAFCTRLLHQFPFEANVAARFGVLDEATESQMLEQLTLDVLLEGAGNPDSALGRALNIAVSSAADQTFRDIVNEAIRKRDVLNQWIAQAGGVEAAMAQLSRMLSIAPDDTLAKVEAEIVGGPLLPSSDWRTAAKIFSEGSANDQKQSERLIAAAAATGFARAELYLSVFFTGDEKPRKSIITGPLAKKYPDLAQCLRDEQQRAIKLAERRRAVACRERTAALLTIAHEVIARYRAEKDRRGLLDYDDQIDKTLALMNDVAAAWVHYKLDLGIDHVLIDEAQDTSPKQWAIISKLVSEFTAGAGARNFKRSMFAVGDDKQSIFSFQGAAPEAFANKRGDFKRDYEAGGLPFEAIEFKYSFRSSQIVLDAVDTVFRQPAAHRGLTADPAPTAHTAVRDKAPGLVEIWPLVEPDETAKVEAWDTPFDTTSETSPRVKLAGKIAANVKTWIARGDMVGDGDARHGVTPGDILVLVRQRGPLFEAIIRALKNAQIPVAGADRLVLTEHIAVMDLMALADALLLPGDDLALATVLKSPLFGLNDDHLFKLAWNRKTSLRDSLIAKAGDDPLFAQAAERLERMNEAARSKTPFAFYAGVLGAEEGRRRFLARLGFEAADVFDEFLNLALDYERRMTPSLQGFVAWLRSVNSQIKRDMEITRDEVRVMTVHGAKGLEAPVVILADTTAPPSGPSQRKPRLLELPAVGAPPDTPNRFVWSARKDDDVAVIATAREAAAQASEDEYRRLLYVAMTRAADRLVICGAVGARGKPEGCWYDLMFAALEPASVKEPADDKDGEVWRFRKGPPETEKSGGTKPVAQTPIKQPDWLRQIVKPEMPSFVTMAPSSAHDDDKFSPKKAEGARERKEALARGTLIHRLLQSLPEITSDRRAEAAQRYLARNATEFTSEQIKSMTAQVLALLNDARFAPLFAAGSRAEVPIVGRLARTGLPTILVSGQVDRLIVTETEILIADYKTNRPAPRKTEDVPTGYVRQLALYRAVLAKLFPKHTLRAVLVWTDVPDLMEISDAALNTALAQVTSA